MTANYLRQQLVKEKFLVPPCYTRGEGNEKLSPVTIYTTGYAIKLEGKSRNDFRESVPEIFYFDRFQDDQKTDLEGLFQQSCLHP